MPTLDKTMIRRVCLEKRKALTKEVRDEASKLLCARIASLVVYQQAKTIALYQAIENEINLDPLWFLAEASGKTCYMPVMMPLHKNLLFLPTTLNTPQKRNPFQVLEPDVPHLHAVSPEKLDLMIIPLVAFDKYGHRLGRGAGYYDRTLEHKKPACLLGAAYEFQRQPLLSKAPWDIPLTGVATEKNMYWSAS